MIDNCVLGSPAYNSGLISHGDIVLRIDGIAVTQSNIHELLVGNDKPGTQVHICLSKGGPKVFEIHHYIESLHDFLSYSGSNVGCAPHKNGNREYS